MNYEEMSEEELWDLSQSEDLEQRAEVLIELGQRNINGENFKLAKNLFGSAADLCQEIGLEQELTRAIYSMGYCHYRLFEHEEAIVHLSHSLKRSQEIGHSRSVAYSAGPLGESHALVGNPDAAIDAHEIAVEAFEEIEEFTSAGVNALSMGELHGRNARQTRALECFIRAYNIFQKGGDAFGSSRAKDRMAAALVELGDLEQAAQHIRDALHTFEHMDIEEQVAYMNYRLGKVLVYQEKFFLALEPLRKAIAYYRTNSNWSSAARAEVELAHAMQELNPEVDNEDSQALLVRTHAYFEAAGEVGYALSVETMQAERLAKKGQLEAALAMFRDVVKRSEEHDEEGLVRSSRVSVAEILFKLGRLTEAKQELDLVDARAWGENRPELDRIEEVKKLMLDTMSLQLNISIA